MSDDDISLSEKRVYAGGDDVTVAMIGSEIGLTRVSISDDIVGEFSLERRVPTTAVASKDGRLAIATEDDVLIGTDNGFEATGFGTAVALTYHDGLIAADGDRIAQYDGTWETLAECVGVRALDGGMAATESGIYRVDGTHVGLDNAYDISTAGTPLAATEDGLYYLANGWVRATEGVFTTVESDGVRAHAATATTMYGRSESGAWDPVELPADGSIVDIAYDAGVYAVTDTGVLMANVGDGWRHRSIGLSGVSGLAIL